MLFLRLYESSWGQVTSREARSEKAKICKNEIGRLRPYLCIVSRICGFAYKVQTLDDDAYGLM